MANLGTDASLLGRLPAISSPEIRSAFDGILSLAEAYRQMGLFDDALEVVEKGWPALPEFSPGYTCLGGSRGDGAN